MLRLTELALLRFKSLTALMLKL